jgi:hypothetical protein
VSAAMAGDGCFAREASVRHRCADYCLMPRGSDRTVGPTSTYVLYRRYGARRPPWAAHACTSTKAGLAGHDGRGRVGERRPRIRQNQGSEPSPRYYWDLPSRTARRSEPSQLLDGCKASRGGVRAAPTRLQHRLSAVKVGPSARASGAPLTGLPSQPSPALFGWGMPAPHPGRPRYASRNGQLIPERLDRQLPTSDNARFRIEAAEGTRTLVLLHGKRDCCWGAVPFVPANRLYFGVRQAQCSEFGCPQIRRIPSGFPEPIRNEMNLFFGVRPDAFESVENGGDRGASMVTGLTCGR